MHFEKWSSSAQQGNGFSFGPSFNFKLGPTKSVETEPFNLLTVSIHIR